MNTSEKPLLNKRMELSLRAVLIRCLDEHGRPVARASGFIRREGEDLWLYTCWHVVTGYDRNDIRIDGTLPNRTHLEVLMQDAQDRQPGVQVIGGLQSLVIPLYDTESDSREPLWHQDKRHTPHPDLNGIGIYVPFWHDAVRLRLPSDTRTSGLQVIEEDNVFPGDTLLSVGDKTYVVGYPYGYSSFGAEQPTPVVLTRFVAAINVGGKIQEVLLDGFGAPCMSGGPVFVERDSRIMLLGLYTGLIYPDYEVEGNDRITALGTCSSMILHLWKALPFVQTPDESEDD